jgi:3-oxoacyl-[acyl-carrier protein] reductase
MLDLGLSGAVVVVTGANNPLGIGAATARVFAAQGAHVFLHFHRSENGTQPHGDTSQPGEARYHAQQFQHAEEIAAEIRAADGVAAAWEADLSDPVTPAALFDAAEAALGPVSVLVNNAAAWEPDTLDPEARREAAPGVWPPRSAGFSTAAFHRLFAVNTGAVALLMSEFAQRHFVRGAEWGRILNISTDGARCFPAEASYGASKLAMESYTRTAAAEMGRLGITVNCLSLGPVQTGWIDAELDARLAANIPVRRVGRPEDVAHALLFLAARQSEWITGQVLHVGGGATL